MYRDPRGGHNRKRINEKFFKNWSPKMAYVLGLIYADGAVEDVRKSSRTCYIAITSKDKDLLKQVRSRIFLEQININLTNPKTFFNIKIGDEKPKRRGHLVLIIVVIVIAIAAVGFLTLKGKGTSFGTPSLPGITQRATEADFSFVEDANLREHFAAQSNQTKYRTRTYSDAADLTFINEVEIKVDAFNTRDIEQDPSGKETKHKVQIGDTIYVKDYSDGAWWKQIIKPEEETVVEEEGVEEEPVDFKEEYSKPDLKFKFLGKEACGNLTCFKYEQTSGGPEGMAFSRIFWFDDKEFLLRKEEVTVGEFTNSVEYSYDGINLVPPTPAKDVPAGKSVFDYYFASPSNQQSPGAPQVDYSLPDFDYGQDQDYLPEGY